MENRSVGTKIALGVTKGVMHFLLNVIFYLVVAILVIKVCTFAYDFSYQLFGDVSVAETASLDREFIINKGESTMSVATKLETNHLIVNKTTFYLKTKLTDQTIMPGIYKLNASMNYDEILAIITSTTSNVDESK